MRFVGGRAVETRTGRFLIADVVALTGVSAPQLRSWERAGLLRPERSGRAVRVYGVEDVARVRLIRRLLDNPGRRGSLRRLVARLASGEVRPEPGDYAGLEGTPTEPTEAIVGVGWRAVLDAVADFVLVGDDEGRVAYVNPALRAATGWGENPEGLAPDRADTLPLQWTARTGLPQRDVRIVLRHSDGAERQTDWNVAPLRGRGGAARGAVAVGRDTSAELALARAQEDQLAVAAHDLRAPVATILGHLQLARRIVAGLAPPDGPDGDSADRGTADAAAPPLGRIARHLKAAERGTRELLRAMETLLDASAAAAGGLVSLLEPEPVDLAALTREATAAVRAGTSRHAVALEVPDEPASVIGDRVRLREVLDNLLANAVKYSPDGGPITVRLEVDAGPPTDPVGGPGIRANCWVTVRVADEGIGIPAGDLPYVFDRYRRAGGEARAVRGAGLGLYASRAIVAAHGGHIWVERTATADEEAAASGEGSGWHGTVVALTLPLTPEEDE
jgi:PAS domain S-box-containing protein